MISEMTFPFLIAHRGYSARYPENTLAAFHAAADGGAPMIELDITLTKDRRIIVIHDDTLSRTTNGRGKVRSRTLEELKTLDAGAWFGAEFSGEKIPTLDEVMAAMPRTLAVNIEIKPEAFESHAPEDAVEKQMMRCISAHDALDRVLVSSFEPRVLQRLSNESAPPRLALLTERNVSDPPVETLKRIDAFSWNAHEKALTPSVIRNAHGSGFRVFAYTVNAPERIQACFRMGVDAIFTDDPTVAGQIS